jgi:peptide/nickel transport system substrate-binding protein
MPTRRTLLRDVIGLAGGIFIASCGPAPSAPASSSPPTSAPAGASAPTSAPAAPKPTSAPAATTAPVAASAPTVAPGGTPGGTPKRGGTLNIVIGGTITTYDTANINYYEERKMIRMVYDPLIAIGDDGQPLAERSLAQSWEFTDPRTFVLHLRTGVKFHDGTLFDAAAAKFNLDRHLDPAIASSARSELTPVASVEAVDAKTLKINLKQPTVAFPVTLFDRSGYQISPAAWQKYGKDNYGANPAGTGPFKVVELVPNDHTTLERNPDYWDSPKPYLDGIVYRTIANDSTRLIELQSGGAHIDDGLPYQDIERIKQMPQVVIQNQLFRLEMLRWNVDSEYGKSKQLRQAFQWALDREAIKRTVYFDTGQVGYDSFHPGTPFYDPNYKPFTRDVNKAKSLLENSGLPSPLKFTYYIPEDPVREREAQIYQANLNDIGVSIDIQKEQTAAANARQDKGDYNFTATWWGWRPDPYFYEPIFQSGGANFSYFQPGQWKDPTFDKLIDDASAEQDPDKRKALYRQSAQLLNDGAAWVFYRFGPIYIGVAQKVHDFTDPRSTIADYAKVWLE